MNPYNPGKRPGKMPSATAFTVTGNNYNKRVSAPGKVKRGIIVWWTDSLLFFHVGNLLTGILMMSL
jgi:hypothetical protein